MRDRRRNSPLVSALVTIGTLGSAGVVDASELRELQSCINSEAARYERVLGQHENRALDADDFDLWTGWYVENCGVEALGLCDLTEDVVDCQNALTQRQQALAAQIRAGLPDPVAVTGADWPVTLYARWHGLAHGSSAGPDCAGADIDPLWTGWCAARQANNGLRDAILAWQLARYLGAAPPAVSAGWAQPLPPLRPVARKENG